MPPRTVWRVAEHTYSFVSSLDEVPIPVNATIGTLLRAVESQVDKLCGRKLVVELSGGLDTSIVIELLTAVGAQFELVGFTSDAYGFRTERAIQEYYIQKFRGATTFRYEDHAAFSGLVDVPIHPLPTNSTHFYSRHRLVASFASSLGSDAVLSGEAGDALFGWPTPSGESRILPPTHARWALSEAWSDQYIYRPFGVNYISFLAESEISAQIYAMRGHARADIHKWWARKSFAELLPRELSLYAYKAFHDGWVVDGLRTCSNDIYMMAAFVFERLNDPRIDPSSLRKLAMQYSVMPEQSRKNFLDLLSFVVWSYAFWRNG
jgi:hypothetical protein